MTDKERIKIRYAGLYRSKVINHKAFCFNPLAIEAVLQGYYEFVTSVFTWANCPCQPYQWVRNQKENWDNSINIPLNEEQISFLKWLIRSEISDTGEDE